MAWEIKPFSRRCFVTEEAFRTGDAYVSFLMVDVENGLQRYDVAEELEEEFEPEGELLCRWRQVYREPEKDESVKRQRETAEGLFLSLFEGRDEGEEDRLEGEEAEIMKKFLGLYLERRRVLRPRGSSPDGRFRLMEHRESKTVYPVPAGELESEELLRISERLNILVGREE